MYAGMLRVRLFEERVRELFAGGRIPGFLHLSIGQEAVAGGVAAALRPDDYMLSTHRGHGHLGANGVLASGCVLAPGVGLAIKHRKSGQVVVTFFGDGAANRGPFHEGVNLAALWKLPVIFVCENNRWASTTAHTLSAAGGSIAARAAGYGIPAASVDGNGVLAVYDAVDRAVARARRGDGPSLVEAHTIRWVGHFEGDPQAYRDKAEVAEGRQRDPIARLDTLLRERKLLDDAGAARIRDGIVAEIDDAVAHAEASPLPAPHDALTDLFAHYPWRD